MPKARILVVEDESLVAMDMEQQLLDRGYEVVGLASSGREAIQKAINKKPDLVLMDIMLEGDMDGIDAAHEIRRSIDIPIVFLTAYADETILKRAQTTNPGGYLVKPFMEESLHTTIQVALSRFPQEKSLKWRMKWFSDGLDCLDNAILMTDSQGRLTFMNKSARELTGLKNEVISGKNVATIFHIFSKKSHTPMENPVLTVLEKRVGIEIPDAILFEGEKGKGLLISVDAKPVTNKQGELTGAVLAFKKADNQSSKFDLVHFLQDIENQNQKPGALNENGNYQLPKTSGSSTLNENAFSTYLDKTKLLEDQLRTSIWEYEAYLSAYKDALVKGDKQAFEYISKPVLVTLNEMRNICQILEELKKLEPGIKPLCENQFKKRITQEFLSAIKIQKSVEKEKSNAAVSVKWKFHWSAVRNRIHILKSSDVPLFEIIQVFLKDTPKLMKDLKIAIQLKDIKLIKENAFALADAIETMEAHPVTGLTILAAAAAMLQLTTEANYLLKQLEKAFIELTAILQSIQLN